MTPSAEIEPGPHWWKASALTTRPTLPPPLGVSLILEIVYGGWTLILQTVMQKFYQSKDPQYGTLLNLLNNYIPLLLSIYSISFKRNHFSEYFRAIIRIWIMFTCLH